MKRELFKDRKLYCPMCSRFLGQLTPDNIYDVKKCKECKGQFQFSKDSFRESKNINGKPVQICAVSLTSNSTISDSFDTRKVGDIIKNSSEESSTKTSRG